MNKVSCKNFISAFIAAVMIIGSLGISAYAAGETGTAAAGQANAGSLDAGASTTDEEAADSVTASAAAAQLASLPGDEIAYGEDYRFDYGLGLFELLPDGYWQTEQVTRADFATVVAKMLKANTAGYPRYGQAPYSDVDETSAAYPAICYLTEIGILNGDGNSVFRPNDPILVDEATKMVMCALGYKEACDQTNGGYPDGYTSFATRQGIYVGLSLEYSGTMTALQMSKLVRNAMETDLMESLVYTSDGAQSYTVAEGESLLTEVYKVNKASGYLTGTYYSMLRDGYLSLENEVMLSDVYAEDGDGSKYEGDVLYQTSAGTDLEEYLGYEVNVYYMEDVSGYRRNYIAYCEPRDGRNVRYDISAGNITEFTTERIVYSDENGRERTIKFKPDYTLFALNGIPTAEVVIPREGKVTIITDGSSSNAKSVIISDFKDALIDRYSENDTTISFQNSSKLESENKKIEIDSDTHIKLTLNGEIIKPEELMKNDAITFTKSADGGYVRGYISREVIFDTVSLCRTEETISGEEKTIVTIGGKEYPVSLYLDKEINAGFTSDFQITYDGRIIGTNASALSSENYGYLIKFGTVGGAFNDSFMVKIMDKTGKVAVYNSAPKVDTNVAGETKRRSAADIAQNYTNYFSDAQLVIFETDSQGRIRSLYRAEDYTASLADPDDLDFGKYYSGTSRYGNNLMINANCAVTDSTLIYRVPFADRDRDEDYQVNTKADLSDGSYEAEIYDIRNGVAAVIVIKDKQPSNLADSADTLIVDELATVWDEESQTKVLEVTGWSKGEKISLKIDEYCSQADSYTTENYENKSVKELRRGDVIQYNKGSNDYLYTYRMLFNYDKRTSTQNYFEVNQDREENSEISNDVLDTLYGQIQRSYDYFLVVSPYPDQKQWYRSYPTTGINLYIYDTERDEITIGESYDITAGDDVFVRTKYNNEQIDMMVIR